jgi:hypothetical protein
VFLAAPFSFSPPSCPEQPCRFGRRDNAIHRLISVNAAHARSPMANGDYATELLNSLDAAHARSPMANGDYATELLNSLDAAHARSPMANGDYATPTASDKHSVTHTPSSPMVSSDHYNPSAGLCRSVAGLAHRHRSAAAQPQGGHSKAYCADDQSGQFVSVVRHGELRLHSGENWNCSLAR